MILADVNVLLGAFRTDASHHVPCKRWLDSVVAGEGAYAVSPQVLSSVVRIVTNRRVYKQPDPLEDVLGFCNQLLSQPHCHVVLPGPRHWEIFCDLSLQADARGELVPDAWFAALAIESGCEWITLDRDFGRFPRLRWRPPF
jgi:uncharacterized protein